VTTLIIDRKTLPEPISSRFHSRRVMFQQRYDGGEATFSPVTDESESAPDAPTIDELFDRLPIDTTGYVFSRSEANNYE
jgi:hypothetical protein